MKVLIVDDRITNSALLTFTFEKKGWESTTALHGEEALALLEENHFDLIISDILMPVMDGFTFCKIVNKHKKWENIPFIFFTETFTSDDDEKLALQMGADFFHLRPFDLENTIDIIEDDLSIFKTRRALSSKELFDCDEHDIYQLYSTRLIKKLEKKAYDLEMINQENKALLAEIYNLSKDNKEYLSDQTNQFFQLSETDLGHYIDGLCESLLCGYKINHSVVKLKIMCQQTLLVKPVIATQIGLAIDELLSHIHSQDLERALSFRIELTINYLPDSGIEIVFDCKEATGADFFTSFDNNSRSLLFLKNIIETQLGGSIDRFGDKEGNFQVLINIQLH